MTSPQNGPSAIQVLAALHGEPIAVALAGEDEIDIAALGQSPRWYCLEQAPDELGGTVFANGQTHTDGVRVSADTVVVVDFITPVQFNVSDLEFAARTEANNINYLDSFVDTGNDRVILEASYTYRGIIHRGVTCYRITDDRKRLRQVTLTIVSEPAIRPEFRQWVYSL